MKSGNQSKEYGANSSGLKPADEDKQFLPITGEDFLFKKQDSKGQRSD